MSGLLAPLDHVVSAFLLAWHEIVGLVTPDDDGWAWTLAIVGMTATVRVLLMPLYVQQMRVRRELRLLEPEIRALRETHRHDQELLMQEQRKLLKATGVKPFVSLLPLALLGLVLVGLLRVIDATTGGGSPSPGLLTAVEAQSLSQAEIVGAGVADSLFDTQQSGTTLAVVVLIAIMCVTHVIAQRQEAAQAPPVGVLSGPVEQKRPVLLYVVLLGLAAVGVFLPLGVLIFWATSKLWTVGEQRLLDDRRGAGL